MAGELDNFRDDSIAELEMHRDTLKRIVAMRLDDRIRRRIDESDIVQEVMIEAVGKLAEWKNDPELTILARLYRLARNRIARAYRDHVERQKRSLNREATEWGLNDHSATELVRRLAGHDSTPSHVAMKKEMHQRVRSSLAQLREIDREILVMRILEGIPAREAGQLLGISEAAVNMRQLRALQRVKPIIFDE